jgi:hypothetical protein
MWKLGVFCYELHCSVIDISLCAEFSVVLYFRCIDQAVLVCKDVGDYRDVASLAERACNLYQQHGSPDSGSASLDKAAKILEAQHPEQALRLYQRAAEVVLVRIISAGGKQPHNTPMEAQGEEV